MPAPKDIKQGKKIDKAEVDKLDKKKQVAGLKEEPSQVSGQFRYDGWRSCPYCGASNYCVGMDSDVYLAFRCWSCGNWFRA